MVERLRAARSASDSAKAEVAACAARVKQTKDVYMDFLHSCGARMPTEDERKVQKSMLDNVEKAEADLKAADVAHNAARAEVAASQQHNIPQPFRLAHGKLAPVAAKYSNSASTVVCLCK
jgi:hypothetical protein